VHQFAAFRERLNTLAVLAILLCPLPSGAIENADALDLIADFADRICTDIPLEGSSTSLRLSGEAEARLSSLLEYLGDLGISGTAEFNEGEYRGLLQADIIQALTNSTNCKLEIWHDLKDRLLPPDTKSDVSSLTTAVGNDTDEQKFLRIDQFNQNCSQGLFKIKSEEHRFINIDIDDDTFRMKFRQNPYSSYKETAFRVGDVRISYLPYVDPTPGQRTLELEHSFNTVLIQCNLGSCINFGDEPNPMVISTLSVGVLSHSCAEALAAILVDFSPSG
jgi:hypothetical protein